MSYTANRGESINPSTTEYIFPNAGFFRARGTGDMDVEFENGTTMTIVGLTAGELVNWLRIKKILDTSTVTSAEVYHIGVGN